MIVVRRLIDWLYWTVMRFMSRQPPRQTSAKETAEVLKQAEEYRQRARDNQ